MITFSALVFLVMMSLLYDKDHKAHKERLFLLEQAERERNQLLNRSMARNLDDYRQSVVTEAEAGKPDERIVAENLLDAQYGPEWRSEV